MQVHLFDVFIGERNGAEESPSVGGDSDEFLLPKWRTYARCVLGHGPRVVQKQKTTANTCYSVGSARLGAVAAEEVAVDNVCRHRWLRCACEHEHTRIRKKDAADVHYGHSLDGKTPLIR